MRRNSWDWQLLGCFERGVNARKEGKSIEECPYNGKGLNRQRADYWRDGWRSQETGTAYKDHRGLREVSS